MHRWRDVSLDRWNRRVGRTAVAVGLLMVVGCPGPEAHTRVKLDDSTSLHGTDADHDAVTRGTVQHEVLEGTNAVPITDGETMPVQVNCRAEAASTVHSPVPYALLVSLETAQPLAASIYAQVKTKIDALHAPIPVRAAAASPARSR